MNFSNLLEVSAHFSDPQNCRDFIEELRWKGKVVCMYCDNEKVYRLKGRCKRFQCADCNKQFSAIKGTIFEGSQVPLQKWLVAMYILSSHKKGISSIQLGKDIGVTQKTAWFMLHRLRRGMMKEETEKLTGIVEIDETYMSRKYKSKYKAIPPEESERMERETIHKKLTKGAVIGMKQRDGEIILKAVDHASASEIGKAVTENVSLDAHLMSDESLKYRKVLKEYKRDSVSHSSGEWVRGNVYNNGVENFWSTMKRGVNGIYHQISYKHLQNYCSEFAFRYNTRDLNDANRFRISFRNLNNKISYKKLTAEEDLLDEFSEDV